MDDPKGEKSGLPKKRIQLPPNKKKISIYSHHNCSGSLRGTNAKAHKNGDAAPAASEDTNDIKLEISGDAIDSSLEAVDSTTSQNHGLTT